MLKIYFRSLKDKELHKIDKVKPGAWIFAYDLQDDELEQLKDLGFDEDLLEDALDFYEVPHVEYEDGINYFFTRYVLEADKQNAATAPVMIAVSDKYILTVSHGKPEFLDDFAHRRDDAVSTQKIKFFLLMMDRIVIRYEKSLTEIRRRLSRFLRSLESVSDKDLKEIVKIESRLTDYISALVPTAASLKDMIARKKTLTLHSDDVDILEDLMLDIEQIIDNAKSVYKTAQNVRATHEVILGHQLNATMKTLTALTIILAIPTILSGFFGMNVWLPLSDGPQSFFFVLFLILLLSAIVTYFFKRKSWL